MKRIDQVQGWLSRVQTIEADVGELQKSQSQEIKNLCLGGYCSKNFKSSYKFGKDVAKRLQLLASLKDEGNFEKVAERVPEDPAVEEPIEPTIIGQESAFDEVWRFISEEQVGIIGLYGTGGVGKTTLLKQINNKFCNEGHDFDLVIWVVVSKDLKLEKIQEEIGKKIGSSVETWGYRSLEDKAREIFNILRRKKFVLFLDDIWEPVNLIKVGVPIPNPNNANKVVFTTRFEEVCGKMEAQKKLRVECLAFKEAWKLFQTKIGDDVLQSHPSIPELAKIVAKECGGLPLALSTIGRAMACKKTPIEWIDAIDLLRSSSAEFSGMDEVYPRLKFSYDRLPSDNVRSCFLYCCLFPEDYSISKRELVDFWIGEGILDGYDGDRAIIRGYSIIGDLVRACLLEEDDGCVKMHDVVRDMALWVTCEIEKEKGIFYVHTGSRLTEVPEIEKWENVRRMSLMYNEIENLVEAPRCPRLETLFMNNNHLRMVSDDFFHHMNSLKVLNFAGNWRLNQVTLLGISKLVTLQYLDLSWVCILELPLELKALVNLKYLNLDYAHKLSKIPRQLISSFSKLQVLKVLHCGLLFEADEDSVLFNDGEFLIDELLCLKLLTVLSISFKSSNVLQNFLRSHKLASCAQTVCLRRLKDSKSLHVSTVTAIKHLHTLYMLDCQELEELKIDCGEQVQSIREVHHRFCNLQKVDLSNCNVLKDLTWLLLAPTLKQIMISSSNNIEVIVSEPKLEEVQRIMGNLIPFEKLEFLKFFRLPNLKSIHWTALPFPCLNAMRVVECPQLKKLPLDSNSAKERKIVITGEEEWWKELQWEDEATQSTFLPCFNSKLYG
ncbi:Disease resistance protein [Melia azedarach]|uniref:Disease resistance protein n=1 Tax=Melia azedarach TaxID=155640 RepID=A0ACC1Y5Q2_MELAZ|nr:Disease resistance protein [Melia azedarach]